MSKEIMKHTMAFLPVSVTLEDGHVAQGSLVQYVCDGGEGGRMHPASGSALMHGSPLNAPLFLYQTPDEVDNALFAFNKDRQVPIYYIDPSGFVEYANGEKLAFNWPSRAKGEIKLLLAK